MDSIHAFRDADGIGFKEALNRALKKRKYLIFRTLREQGSSRELASDEESSNGQGSMELADDINIWKEFKSDGDIFEKLRKHILFCRSL